MPRLSLIPACALVLALGSLPTYGAQRAYVASYGNDANAGAGCLLTAPCRGFAAAHTVVDPEGEIVALDAAGYGAVTITKSVTITANPGFYAGIAAASGNAVTIATPGVQVVLRGLNINGIGAGYGINMTAGSELAVENCVITNFTTFAIYVSTAAAVNVVDSVIRSNDTGIYLAGGARATISASKLLNSELRGLWVHGITAGTTTRASITDSVVSGNLVGIQAFTEAATSDAFIRVMNVTVTNNGYGVVSEFPLGGLVRVSIGNSLVTDNTIYGLRQTTTALLESLGNNLVSGNATNVSGTITPLGGI